MKSEDVLRWLPISLPLIGVAIAASFGHNILQCASYGAMAFLLGFGGLILFSLAFNVLEGDYWPCKCDRKSMTSEKPDTPYKCDGCGRIRILRGKLLCIVEEDGTETPFVKHTWTNRWKPIRGE